jgi:hypothetical protein
MHYVCLVVGPDPETQLEPFSDGLEVPRYKSFLDADEITLMAEHFSLPASDLAALAARMPEWEHAEAGVEDGRLFRWSTSNPHSKYDWYERGGRFTGYLRLKQPRQPAGWRRLLGGKPNDRVDQARKGDVDEAPLLADPPAALLVAGVWHESAIISDQAELEKWRRQFAELFVPVPADALLTVVDLHS